MAELKCQYRFLPGACLNLPNIFLKYQLFDWDYKLIQCYCWSMQYALLIYLSIYQYINSSLLHQNCRSSHYPSRREPLPWPYHQAGHHYTRQHVSRQHANTTSPPLLTLYYSAWLFVAPRPGKVRVICGCSGRGCSGRHMGVAGRYRIVDCGIPMVWYGMVCTPSITKCRTRIFAAVYNTSRNSRYSWNLCSNCWQTTT